MTLRLPFFFLLLFVLGLTFALGGQEIAQAPPAATAHTALDHVTIIDGTGAPAMANATVLISGRTIQAVYLSGSRPMPTGANVVVDLARPKHKQPRDQHIKDTYGEGHK
jgi:hypothetical protein